MVVVSHLLINQFFTCYPDFTLRFESMVFIHSSNNRSKAGIDQCFGQGIAGIDLRIIFVKNTNADESSHNPNWFQK